jgi:uncharacterized protein (TIGR03437 family)
VTVSIDGVPVEVSYAGAQPEYPGLDQVNVLLPQELAGRDEVDVVVKVDDTFANKVRILVR